MTASESWVSLLFGLALICFVVWLVLWAIAITIVIALILLGLASFLMAKSGRALVPEPASLTALASACAWAGTLALGCMLGSAGLAVALAFAFGDAFTEVLVARYSLGSDHSINQEFLYNWLIRDAFAFFFSATCTLYLANRVYIARKRGGTHWLGVIPPVGAMLIFFVTNHRTTILELITTLDRERLEALLLAAFADAALPIELSIEVITEPRITLEWAQSVLFNTHGSFFQLGQYFPSLFCIIAVGLAFRHMFWVPDDTSI